MGLLLLALVWQGVHGLTGSLVLPSPLQVARRVAELLALPGTAAALSVTLHDSLFGLLAGGGLGLLLGLAAGLARPVGSALRPIVTLLMGVPHIAWVVLALLWFGPRGMAPGFTVAVTCLPLLFFAAWHGMQARDPQLAAMAAAFRLPLRQRLQDVVLPQLAMPLRAAGVAALGMAVKVAIMAELLSGGTGVGGQIATARAYLESDLVLAWIVLVVLPLLPLEAALARLRV